MTPPAKPLPNVDDPLTAPFWAATRESRLVLPECGDCGYLQWPPERLCPECQHANRNWLEFPATGTLWSYAVYYRAFDPAFADDIPYAVGLVELDAGRMMYGLMVDDESALQIGARVRGCYDRVNDKVTLLRWRIAAPLGPLPLVLAVLPADTVIHERDILMALFRRGMHFGSYGSVDDGTAVFDRLQAAVELAESVGFDAISVPDHLQQNDVGGGADSPMFDAYTLLGALALITTSARLFALVSPVTLRSPALLAKAVTTVDVLSRGRAVLGIGAGWDASEHQAYGIPFPSAGTRFHQLDEALTLCRTLFRDQRATVTTGTYYSVNDARNSPRPLNGTIPVLVAGSGERRTLDLVARHGDACNVVGDPGSVQRKFSVLEEHCERVGRDPAEITKTVFVFATDDMAKLATEAQAFAKAGADGITIVGPEEPGLISAIGAVFLEAFPG